MADPGLGDATPKVRSSSASPVPPSFTFRSVLSSGPLEWPFCLASSDKWLTLISFLSPFFSPEEMFMGFEASEAVGGMEGFLDGSVFFPLSCVFFLHIFFGSLVEGLSGT